MKRNLFIIITILGVFVVFLGFLGVLFLIPASRDKLQSRFSRIASRTAEDEWIVNTPVKIWQRDPLLGFRHIPNSRGVQIAKDFTATYTIGDQGERVIPQPESQAGRVIFLGGSFTFGEGVADDETFSYLLSQQWKDRSISNFGVMGWGTSHAWFKLTELFEISPQPDVVFYVMIPHHIARNYIRKSWVDMMASYDRGHPHLELENGRPVFKGLTAEGEAVEFPRSFQDVEIRITQALLRSMQEACRTRNVRFVLVELFRPLPSEILDTIREAGIERIDLSNLKIEGFGQDPHPNPRDHQRIAEAIDDAFEF